MAKAALRSDEWAALAIAAVLHGALVWVLLQQPDPPPALPKQERVTVSLATEVGLEATAPDPVPESAARLAPELGEALPPPEPEVLAAPEPAPVPQPVATTPPKPKPVPKPAPKPTPKETSKPKPKPPTSTAPRRRPDTPSTSRSSTVQQTQPTTRAGGSRRSVSDAFDGMGESTTSRETRMPASQIGASAKASLVQAIARRIKPKWTPPDGPEVEKITTYLRFRLNPDGTLAGRPEVIRQTGVNDINRAQAARHAENAVRAVQLAAPFDDLPDEYYNAWKLVSPFSFDWKLSQ
ncbi:MAG: energy transducer TonB [Sphingomonadaceae bacterium]